MDLFGHALAALLVQTVIALLLRRRCGTATTWWIGAALPCAYFVGREVAQAEYRWIEAFGGGLRANMPWWAAFDVRVWTNPGQWADWLGPLLGTFALAWFQTTKRRAGHEIHSS